MSEISSSIQCPDLTPCIQQEAYGARNCIVLFEWLEKDMIKVYDTVSQSLTDHSDRCTRHLNDDRHLAEYPLIKQRLIALASIGNVFANCFNIARQEIKKGLAAMTPCPKRSFEKEMRHAHEQVDTTDKRLADLIKDQNKIQRDLNKIDDQLSDTLLKKSKRDEFENEKEKLENRLQRSETGVQSAREACQTVKIQYAKEAVRLFNKSQRREYEQLQKLNTSMQRYIENVQIPSYKKMLGQIGDQLTSEKELQQDLRNWQRKFIGTNTSDRSIAIHEQQSRSYVIDEPSSDDSDEEDDDSMAVVKYEASRGQRQRR